MGKRPWKNGTTSNLDGPQLSSAKRLKSNGSCSFGYSQTIDGQTPPNKVHELGSTTNPVPIGSDEDEDIEEDGHLDFVRFDRDEDTDKDTDKDIIAATAQVWKLPLQKVQEWRQSGKKKIYCVRHGHIPGFYADWEIADAQVKKVHGNVYKGFTIPKAKKGLDSADQNLQAIISDAEKFMNDEAQNARAEIDYRSQSGKKSSIKNDSTPEYKMKSKDLCMHCQGEPQQGERLCTKCLESADRVSNVERIATERQLADEQRQLLDLASRGKNLFFIGVAGTGKSTVLKAIVSLLRESGLTTMVVAPTGIAAIGLELNATTLHTYAGLTPKSEKKSLEALRGGAHIKETRRRFRKTHVLIIDEISMVSSNMFTQVSAVVSRAIGKERECPPFGGVQLIVTGDFFQLPPVLPFKYCVKCGKPLTERKEWSVRSYIHKNDYEVHPDCHRPIQDREKWAFKSLVWEDCQFIYAELKQIHRQADPYFANILSQVRRGKRLALEEMNNLRK